jgi:RNA polymerase sigma-70 factor (ECF subfamily)
VTIGPQRVSNHAAPNDDREVSGDVIRLAAKGVERAQRAIFDAHAERIFRLAARMIGDVDLAHDVTQDVFVRAFERLPQFRHDAKLGTWLHRIAVTVTLNVLRKQRSIQRRELPLESAREIPSEAHALEPDQRERLRAALEQLPEELRLVMIMYDVEGYAHDEIAAALGISAGACRMRLLRARENMRTLLSLDGSEWVE